MFFCLSYRLKQELESLAADKCQKYHTSLSALKYKFHTPPTKPNIAAWLGGMENLVATKTMRKLARKHNIGYFACMST